MDNSENSENTEKIPKSAGKNAKRNPLQRFFAAIKRTLCDSEYGYLTAAFFLPLLITWLVYIAMGCYPFGNNSVLVLDLNGQYVSFFEKLREIILGGDSVIYSFERSLGGEFMGIYAYYLASPFSLIVALFPKIHITEAILTIILLKSGFCGLTFGLYLHHTYPTTKTNVVIFSTMYATSAYMMVQAHNTMWIDELIILPLLMLGIDRLIRRRSNLLYCTAIALALIVNFYIGFMMCIFTLFYFFFRYFSYTPEQRNPEGVRLHFLRVFCRIGLTSLIGIMIAAMIILPAYYSLTFGKTTFSTPNWMFTQKFDLADLLVKFLPGSYDTVRPEGLPFVYCGTLCLIMAPLFFFTSGIKVREKIWAGVALVFFTLSFDGSTIDLVWHGFQKPNWLNYRYSFMLIMFVVLMAYRAFGALGERSGEQGKSRLGVRYALVCCGLLLLFVFIIQKLDYEFVDDFKCIWVSAGCLGIWAAVLGGCFSGDTMTRKSASFVVLCAMSVEMFAAGLLNTTSLDEDVVYTSRTTYVTHMERCNPLFNRVLDSDDSFFRMEKAFHRKTNDPMAFDYNGISNSSSTLNASVITLLNQLGFASKSNWSKYLGGTPVSNALLGIKYLIVEEEQQTKFGDEYAKYYESYMEDVDESNPSDSLYAYYNPWQLGIAFAANRAILDLDFEEPGNPFELMNEMVTALLGEEDTVRLYNNIRAKDTEYDNCDITFVTGHKKYSPENENRDARIVMTIEGQGEDTDIYMFVPTEYPRECVVTVGGEEVCRIMGNDSDCIQNIGAYPEGEEVYVALKLEDDVCYIANGAQYFYTLDDDLFRECMTKLGESVYNVTDFSDTYLDGTVTVPEGSGRTTLFTTIPYDEDWEVYVDGSRAELLKTGNALLSVPVSEGEHRVTFKYRSVALTAGFTLTAGGLLLYAGVAAVDIILRRRRENAELIPVDIEMTGDKISSK